MGCGETVLGSGQAHGQAPEGRKRGPMGTRRGRGRQHTPTASAPPMTDRATHGRLRVTLTAAVEVWCRYDAKPVALIADSSVAPTCDAKPFAVIPYSKSCRCDATAAAPLADSGDIDAVFARICTVPARRGPPSAGACAAVGAARAARDGWSCVDRPSRAVPRARRHAWRHRSPHSEAHAAPHRPLSYAANGNEDRLSRS